VLFFLFVVGGLGTWASVILFQVFFSWNVETHLLASIRTILTFEFLIVIFPVSVAVELLYVKWKKRQIRMSNILILGAMFFEFLVVMFALSWVFDTALPGLYFANEPFVGVTGFVLGLTISLPILVIVLTSRIRRLREYVNKSFE